MKSSLGKDLRECLNEIEQVLRNLRIEADIKLWSCLIERDLSIKCKQREKEVGNNQIYGLITITPRGEPDKTLIVIISESIRPELRIISEYLFDSATLNKLVYEVSKISRCGNPLVFFIDDTSKFKG